MDIGVLGGAFNYCFTVESERPDTGHWSTSNLRQFCLEKRMRSEMSTAHGEESDINWEFVRKHKHLHLPRSSVISEPRIRT